MAADLDAVIRRALEYPYPAPPHSYLYDAARPGGWAPLPADAGLLEGRTPVLAVGSNRAPERLAQKFAEGENVRDYLPANVRVFWPPSSGDSGSRPH